MDEFLCLHAFLFFASFFLFSSGVLSVSLLTHIYISQGSSGHLLFFVVFHYPVLSRLHTSLLLCLFFFISSPSICLAYFLRGIVLVSSSLNKTRLFPLRKDSPVYPAAPALIFPLFLLLLILIVWLDPPSKHPYSPHFFTFLSLPFYPAIPECKHPRLTASSSSSSSPFCSNAVLQ